MKFKFCSQFVFQKAYFIRNLALFLTNIFIVIKPKMQISNSFNKANIQHKFDNIKRNIKGVSFFKNNCDQIL